MLPQPAETFALIAARRRERELTAATERLRPRSGARRRAAQLLRLLADRIAPASVAPGDGRLAHR